VSAILGIFAGSEHQHESAAASMLDAMRARGALRAQVSAASAGVLAVARSDWELDASFSGDTLVAEDGDLAIAADATLYYRDDLRRELRNSGVTASGTSASHLILAAYRAWGAGCTARLEGDWAFIIHDRAAGRVFCARDFGGKRPLFYAEPAGTLLVASTISALLTHPLCTGDLDLAALAAQAAGLFAVAHETVYRSIRVLPAGWSLSRAAGLARPQPHWTAPEMRVDRSLGFDEASEELRALLRAAVAERLPTRSAASVWLSGGWDSTAVFGSGQAALRGRPEDEHLRPVSLSFPPGDSGREDELIQSVAAHWRRPVRWIDVSALPLLDTAATRAAARDEPFAHAFEVGNRALAAASRETGTRVAFDGSGGDQLFQVTPVYLADLLRTFRWLDLRREWRRRQLTGSGFRTFFRWAVQPVLPAPALGALRLLAGREATRGYLERPIPEWIDPHFARVHDLVEREATHAPQRTGPGRADHETRWYLTHPYFPRVFSAVASFALEAGVELRSPLYDRRIVEFALRRPREERSSGIHTKRLLRHAMRGLLPADILAPRRFRTGTSGSYMERSLREHHAEFIDRTLRQPLELAAAGIVNDRVLLRNWERYLATGGGDLGVNLFLTLQSELWLRARR
jgi:asparagine synthase (glutamine-hydrolysing)